MQPVKWASSTQEEELKSYLFTELTRALQARMPLERQWRSFLEKYRAPAATGVKDWPFLGAPLARDTEILTRWGWKRIDAVAIGEDVLTRRDTDGALEWHPVQALPQHYAEKLYHFKSRAMDLLVTEDHAMVVEQENHPGVVRRMPAKMLWGKTGYYLPQHGTWLDGNDHKQLWGRDPESIAEFIGWYLAEGSAMRSTAGNRVYSALSIAQSETANPENRRRLETLFERCGFTYRAYPNAYTVHKSSIPTGLFDLLAGSGLCDAKRIPAICWGWSAKLLDKILTGLVLGDGCIHDDYPMNTFPAVTFYTTSKGLSDDIQRAACLVGLHARIRSRSRVGSGGLIGERKIEAVRRSYEIALCSAKRAKYARAYHEIVDYHDIAYCVTVKNHAIYVRRNGKAVWTGNSNKTLPIMATDGDQFYAKFMQSLHASEDLWSIQAMNERWIDTAKPLQDFLSALDRSTLKMYRVNKRAVMEMVKLGTAVLETGWTFEDRPINTYDEDGKIVAVNRVESRPFVDHVRLIDFLIPPYAYAIQPDEQGGAPWVAKRVRMTREQLLATAKTTEPFLPNIGMKAALEIMAWDGSKQTEYDDKIQGLTYEPKAKQTTGTFENNDANDGQPIGGVAGSYLKRIEMWEFHIRWAVAGDSPSDLVILFHAPTNTILRAIYQPYLHGQRPFEVIRFFPTEGFYGIGVCEQTELFQDSGSELYNYLFDNILLSNSQMLAVKEGANIAPGEPIYPSKVITTQGNPRDEIMGFTMGNGVYPGLSQLLGLNDQMRMKRDGIGDLQTGNIEGIPGRTPATTVQSLLAEGNRRPDLTMKDMRYEGLSLVGLRVIQLLQQFMTSKVDLGGQRYVQMMHQVLGEPEGAKLAAILMDPTENAELGLGVEIAAASATANKDAAKQQSAGLLTLMGQTYPQLIQMGQLAMQTAGTPVGAIALKALGGLSELMGRVMEQHDVRDTETFVPEIPEAPPVNFQPPQVPAGALGAGSGGPPGSPAPAGMGGVPQGV